jgi:hypothetical protein
MKYEKDYTAVEKMRVTSSPGVAAALTCLLLLGLLAGLTEVVYAEDWTPITPPDSPGARQGHSMVTLPDGRVLLFGGWDGGVVWFNDTWAFDPVEYNWEKIIPANTPPLARRDHGAWVRDGKMLVFGGIGAGGTCFNDLWSYDQTTNYWTEHLPNNTPPGPRGGLSMVGHKDASTDYLLISGGTDQSGTNLMDTWRYNFQTGDWDRLSQDHAPSAFQTEALFDTAFHLYGGVRFGSTDFRDDVRIITLPHGNEQYVYTSGDNPGPRAYQFSVQYADRWFNFGGDDGSAGSTLADCYVFDANDNSWTRCMDMPIALKDAAAAPFEAKSVHILVFGGLQSDGNVSGRTFEYIPDGGEAAHPQQAPEFSLIGLLALIGAVSVALAVTTSRRRN